MFRIGVFELGLTCGFFLLLVIIPVLVARYYDRVDRRLKNIERKMDEKKD